jgi:hypothetical protein
MATDRLERAGLNRAWISASAALPVEWRLEGLTCASTGLALEQRSDRWQASATGPNGERIEAKAEGPVGALHALARELRVVRGSRAARDQAAASLARRSRCRSSASASRS